MIFSKLEIINIATRILYFVTMSTVVILTAYEYQLIYKRKQLFSNVYYKIAKLIVISMLFRYGRDENCISICISIIYA